MKLILRPTHAQLALAVDVQLTGEIDYGANKLDVTGVEVVLPIFVQYKHAFGLGEPLDSRRRIWVDPRDLVDDSGVGFSNVEIAAIASRVRARNAPKETVVSQLVNAEILRHVYMLCAEGREQAAVEAALQYLEHELREGRFVVVDAFMRDVDVSKLRAAVLLTIASITKHGDEHLTERERFMTHAETQMIAEIGVERTTKLLEYRR